MWSAIAAIAAALIGGIATYVGTKKTNDVSKQISDENIAFQQDENAITRIREDNAQQRAAADLQAAGLSKTLAAGNPASAQALTAPQANYSYVSPIQKAMEKMNLKQTILDIESHQKDIEKQNAEIEGIKANTAATNLSNQVFMQRFTDQHNLNEAQVAVAKTNIKLMESQERLNHITGEYKAQEIEATIDEIIARTSRENASKELIREQIRTELKKQLQVSTEVEMLAEDIALNKLRQKEMQLNLDYAEMYGLPVGQTLNGTYGGVINAIRSLDSQANNFSFLPRTSWNFGGYEYADRASGIVDVMI